MIEHSDEDLRNFIQNLNIYIILIKYMAALPIRWSKTDCAEGTVKSLEVNKANKPTTLKMLQINHIIIIDIN